MNLQMINAYKIFVLAAITIGTSGRQSSNPLTTAQWTCRTPGFSILCKALDITGVDKILDGPDYFTLFAPSDEAFEKLPDGTLEGLYSDTSLLRKILLFHAVGKTIFSADLACTKLIEMANGNDSRTVCKGGKIFQKGAGNSDDKKPEITHTDIPTYNGVIHVVNNVMLPPQVRLPVRPPMPPSDNCSSIVDMACNDDRFTLLCAAVRAAELVDELDGPNPLTLFAPTDSAFENLPEGALDALLLDIPTLRHILLFHAAEGKDPSSELKCTQLLQMANGIDSRTVCRGSKIFQKGGSNPDDRKPEIIAADLPVCNGYIHVVNQVMLPPPPRRPNLPVPPSPPPQQCKTVVDIACNTPGLSTLCDAITAAGLTDTLAGSNHTIFAPTNEAFNNLPTGMLDTLLSDSSTLSNILLFHVSEEQLLSEDLKCTELLHMANGNDSRTICKGNQIFQKGSGNTDTNRPEIILANIPACDGIVHVVNQVMLPPSNNQVMLPPSNTKDENECLNVADFICQRDDLTELCTTLKDTGLDLLLNGQDSYTVFAPTNNAFASLPYNKARALYNDIDTAVDILLFHAVAGEVYSSDLECTKLVPMANGKNSRTVCRGSKIFQKGAGNSNNKRPEIINADLNSCNGVVHVVNEVMLPP